MKSLHIISDKDDAMAFADIVNAKEQGVIAKDVDIYIYYANGDKSEARKAKTIVNQYAVTKLPFVVLKDDSLPKDEQEYAAVYSEEGPITVDRIKAKL